MTSFVKVVQNVLGQSVFSVKLAGQSDFVMQPDLSFNAGDVYTFDVSDPSMSGYSLVFGTEVDVASSIASTYTTVNGTTLTLNIPGGYTGGVLYYFDNTNAGMGYITGGPGYTQYSMTQKGTPFTYNATHVSSANANTNIIAVSDLGGQCKVYELIGSTWTQKGATFDFTAGNKPRDNVVLSDDGLTVAHAEINYGTKLATVKVYDWDTNTSAWVQRGSDTTSIKVMANSVYFFKLSGDGNSFIMSSWVDNQYTTNIQTGIINVFSYNSVTSVWDNVLTSYGDDVYAGRLGWSVHISYNADFILAVAAIQPANSKFFRKKNGAYVDASSESGFPTKNAANSTIMGSSISANGKCIAWVDSNLNQMKVYSYDASSASWSQKGAGIEKIQEAHVLGRHTYLDTTGSKLTLISAKGDADTSYAIINTYAYDGVNWNEVSSIQYSYTIDYSVYRDSTPERHPRESNYTVSRDGLCVVASSWYDDNVTVYELNKVGPTVYKVTKSNNVFHLNGEAAPSLTFNPGETYVFDQSDSTNTDNTFVLANMVDTSANYINYQTLYGTPGQPGAYTTFIATSDTPSYLSYEVYASVPSLPAPVGDVYEVASISADVDDDTKTGTTPALKRTFTRNAVTNMLNQYKTQLTGNKALKLAAGTKLPGFTIAPDKEITLRDARVTKTFTKDELANKTTYMVLNDSDPVTLKSAEDDTVTVTQSGTNFTVVTPAGTTNKVAGDTFEYDGLSLQFGSLVVNLSLIPPVDLALTAFDSAFVLTQQAVLPDVSYALDVSAEITLTQQISAADLSGVFFFKTDEDITSELVTDTSNVEYYLDRSQFTGGQATLNAMNGLVTTGYYGSNTTDHLGKDFLRDMAHQLFSTHFGVDLFTNEDAVITDISGKSAVIATDIFDKMGNVDKTNTALSGPDVSYGYYTTDTDSSNTNLTREILNQLLTLAPGRFTDKTTLRLDTAVPGVYGMPFVTNDTISYKLSVTAHASQNTTIATGKPGLGTRTYKVIFKVL